MKKLVVSILSLALAFGLFAVTPEKVEDTSNTVTPYGSPGGGGGGIGGNARP